MNYFHFINKIIIYKDLFIYLLDFCDINDLCNFENINKKSLLFINNNENLIWKKKLKYYNKMIIPVTTIFIPGKYKTHSYESNVNVSIFPTTSLYNFLNFSKFLLFIYKR